MENMIECNILEKLRERGHRITPQRMEIVNELCRNYRKHPSINQVYRNVKKRIKIMSFSTLYTTILMLEKEGFLKTFDCGGETRIEMNMKEHVNIVNEKTRKIEDVENKKIVEEVRKIVGGRDFIINVIVC